MPHPFFDANVYPWKRADAIKLHTDLYTVIDVAGRITSIYDKAGGTQPLSPNLAADLAWREVLNLLTAGRNLQTLCGLVLAEPGWKAIHDSIRAVQAAVPVTPIPLL